MSNSLRTAIRGLGQLLITLGVIVLIFVAYELWFTDVVNARVQHRLTTQLEKRWRANDDPLVGTPTPGTSSSSPPSSSTPAPGGTGRPGEPGLPGAKITDIPIGTGIAIIRMPRLGLDYARTIVQGTGDAQLLEGPGHYPQSPLPGQIGDVGIAGHRVSKGSPFLDLDKLRPGDAIVIETKSFWYTYRVLGDPTTGSFTAGTPQGIPGREVVTPDNGAVLDPVPDHPGEAPTMRLLTLTTCTPKFSASHRLIIHARLAGSPRPTSAGPPPALSAGASASG